MAGCRLMDVRIESVLDDSPPATFRVTRSEDLKHVEMCTEVASKPKVSRVVPLAIPGDIELLADELEVRGKDRLYDAVVREASRLAGREVSIPS
jgi:hypothetical protein